MSDHDHMQKDIVIEQLYRALLALCWKCETNYIFGEDEEEQKALNDALELMEFVQKEGYI